MMYEPPITIFAPTLHGVICFEDKIGYLEVRRYPPAQTQLEIPHPQSRALCANTSLFWNDKRPLTVSFLDTCETLPVFFLDAYNTLSLADEAVRGLVKAGAQDWARGTSLRFKFLRTDEPNQDQANIRISFRGNGSHSVVGTTFVPAGDPTMNLCFQYCTTEREMMGLILHEFGHALGFLHEHSSPQCPFDLDRNAIAEYYKDRLLEGTSLNDWIDVNFMKLEKERAVDVSPFDERSIMMYEILPSWSDAKKRIGGSQTLSDMDRQMVRKWYPPYAIEHEAQLIVPIMKMENPTADGQSPRGASMRHGAASSPPTSVTTYPNARRHSATDALRYL
ncbi:hypothetical protein F5Y10DRAFT_234129 [Nemania abortiva]|nr:hypothetical protein F5Y10DRAFT_234129 [Nemania abortiva]